MFMLNPQKVHSTDAHCHLQDVQFDTDRDEVVRRAEIAGIRFFCCDSIDEADWDRVLAMRNRYGSHVIRAGLGIHPWYVHNASAGWEQRLTDRLAEEPDSIVAEIGLDMAKSEDVPFELQLSFFRTQLQIARDLSRAVTVHCVRAWGPMTENLGSFAPPIIFHSYNGSAETARQLLIKYDAWFSFGTSMRRPDKHRYRETFRSLPPERILFESDAPYLPLIKGTRNEPGLIDCSEI